MRTETNRKGLTLIEVMVVVLIIAVAVIGAMSFRFYCVTDAKKADVFINGERIGSMLLENWKGLGCLPTYEPQGQFGTFFNSKYTINTTTSGSSPSPGLLTKLTSCQIKDLANNVYYYVTLSFTTGTSAIPLALNASISWNQKYDTGSPTADTISLTTYAD